MILTIITPVFNGSAFLKSCIQNVANQWHEGIEHLIIDGGSTDGTIEILMEAEVKWGHLRWLSEKDKGQSDAMNKGINLAKGKWISFLNADDFYEPDILSHVLKKIKDIRTECVLVGNLNIWNDREEIISVNKPSNMSLPLLLADFCEWPYNPSAYFYPKSIHEKIGFFPENEHYAMDYDFILKVSMAKIQFKYFNETWGNFRLLPNTKTSTDQISNTSYTRAEELRKSFRKRLGMLGRLHVNLLIGLWKIRNKIWSTLRLNQA